MEKSYRVLAAVQVGGCYYLSGDIVSEDAANRGYPSLNSIGVAALIKEERGAPSDGAAVRREIDEDHDWN
jgi:hypothetical protein